MKILFFCGSVEPGQDGVGDYTRRLCVELIRLGHKVQIVSLCDQQVTDFVIQNQRIESSGVLVKRIPIASSSQQRLVWIQKAIDDEQPDWISLQYVPYSFNPKGLPFWLPNFLNKLKGKYQWHIMFHELWVGIDLESSLKHKCIGKLQQFIAKKLIVNLNPSQINTQNGLYQFHLRSVNIGADILPLFGNIPVIGVKNKVKKSTQFVLFGTIHSGAPFEDFIIDLVSQKTQLNNPIEFVFIGKNGPELSHYTSTLEDYSISYDVLGIQSEEVISEILINSDFGISTTPYYQTEKSGVYAAYREHQINTISISRNWSPSSGQYTISNVIKYEKNNLDLTPIDIPMIDSKHIAKMFINSIA